MLVTADLELWEPRLVEVNAEGQFFVPVPAQGSPRLTSFLPTLIWQTWRPSWQCHVARLPGGQTVCAAEVSGAGSFSNRS